MRASFEQVAPIAETAAELFYGRLFEVAPEVRPLFRGDMKAQGRALMGIIGVAVKGLDKLEQIVPAVQEMGRRHAGYGVQESHYQTVGACLLWTLEKGLGDGFTPPVKDAWTTAYTLLAETMKAAARDAEAKPAPSLS